MSKFGMKMKIDMPRLRSLAVLAIVVSLRPARNLALSCHALPARFLQCLPDF